MTFILDWTFGRRFTVYDLIMFTLIGLNAAKGHNVIAACFFTLWVVIGPAGERAAREAKEAAKEKQG